MPAILQCACGHRVELKAEFVGRQITCPKCGATNTAVADSAAPAPVGDPVFQRDSYLLKQQLMTISEKYDIADESGNPVLFAERPRHFLRGMAAAFAVITAFFGTMFLGFYLADMLPKGAGQDVVGFVFVLAAFPAAFFAIVALAPLRHTYLYRNESKREKLVEILQDQKVALITATYSVRDAQGAPLARLRKNYLYNLFRKRWHVLSPDGALLFVAMEDSMVLSLLRRLLGPLFGVLRTNFVIQQGEDGPVIGEFNRKMTLFDKYVLDLKADRLRVLDRRLAVALGVMLDTGERR